uniref:Uncharacterized protein n=1 Tax=Arundo donax TaxID=35708 RepID=A0A0A9ERS9_ARUDO
MVRTAAYMDPVAFNRSCGFSSIVLGSSSRTGSASRGKPGIV